MKIHVICVAYYRDIPLRGLVDSFLLQTDPNWLMYVIHDGKTPPKVKRIEDLYADDRILFTESDKRNKSYGHPNRRYMLNKLPSNNDYVLMTNDDNYYIPRFVEFMLREAADDVGIIYCDTVHSHCQYNINYSELRETHIDMGAFIVRLDIAKRVGFKENCFAADGKFAEACNKYCLDRGIKTVHIPKTLFVHN